MRGRHILRAIQLKPPNLDQSSFSVIILALFFLVGTYVGFQFSACCDQLAQDTLSEYLINFRLVMEEGTLEFSFWRTAVSYLIYIVAVFLSGFSSLGVVVIPVLSAVFGFGTMYAASCFVHTFARPGIMTAVAVLSTRLIFTLTTFLFFAGEALPQSARLASVTMLNRKHSGPILRGKRYLALFLFCVFILLLGVCCERLITPLLFQLISEQIL